MEFLSGLDKKFSLTKEPSKSQDPPTIKEHNDSNPPKSKDQTELTETLAWNQAHTSNSNLVNQKENSESKTASDSVPVDMNKLFHQEFKISGHIGAPEAEDKLSVISLVRQIESALPKGYQENEIIDAVIRAISPAMSLIFYLKYTGQT